MNPVDRVLWDAKARPDREEFAMAQFDALSKAKKAAEQAAQAAAGIKESAASRAGDLKDKLAGKVAEIKDAALVGIRDVVDDLNQHLPALREAGYTLTHVAVEVGIAPKVKATFTSAPDISEERIDAIVD